MSREALVVGINRYPVLKDPKTKKPKHLSLPAADAEAVAQTLETYGNFRVRRMPKTYIDGNWRVHENPDTTKLTKMTHLEKAIELLFNPPSDVPDTAILYFAGHGLVKESSGGRECFLASSDVNGKSKWGVSFHWLRRVLLNSPVRQKLVWLDCCHSGGLLKDFHEADPGAKGRGDICLIAASREFEVAYEGLGDDHGVLTGTLLAALNPENHQASWVTNYDLVDYINSSLANTLQRPVYRNFGGEIVITGEKEQVQRADLLAQVCPYKGLESFDFNDEDPQYFFGRTALVDELLDRLREGNFLAVVGASGSGKSSVVKAGLLHQLKLGQRLSDSDEWKIVIFRPGEHPLQSLVRAFGGAPDKFNFTDGLNLAQLVRITGYPGVVLVADQFEEAFTLCQDMEVRQKFFACLLGALDRPNSNLRVIITMRADFFGKCAEEDYSGLARKIQDNLVTVGPMKLEEFREAIRKPADIVGLEVQGELVEQMLSDVEGPGSLPLLQYTLTQLWQNREVNRLTLAEYVKLGGVKGTLPKRAEEVYSSLDAEQQSAAKRIFLDLMQLGEGTEDTRRQVIKSDLVNEYHDKALIDATVGTLVEGRLLVTSELQGRGEGESTITAVDVAHEALIRNWSRLRGWVNDNRDALRIARQIQSDAEGWLSKGKRGDYLLAGVKLSEAQVYRKKYGELGLLSNLAKEFIEKSAKRKRNNRLCQISLGVCVLLSLSGLTIFSLNQAKMAEKQRKNADTERKKAQKQAQIAELRADAATVKNILDAEPVNALALAIKTTGDNLDMGESEEIHHEVQSSLRDAITQVRETNIFEGHNSYVSSVGFSPDGKLIVSGSSDNTIRLWSREGKPIGSPFKGHEKYVSSVAFSPDGKLIVSGSWDKTIRLWDLEGNPIGKPFRGHQGQVSSVAFSPDGKLIVSGSSDNTIRLWDRWGNPIGSPFKGHENGVSSVAFSPDGKYIVSGSWDNKIRLWDTKGNSIGLPFKGHESAVFSVAFSPDGKYIVSGSRDKTIRLWSREGNSIRSPFTGHEGDVSSVAFSPDGKYIVSGSGDKTIRLWSREGNSIGLSFKGHDRNVDSVAFSPDGKYIVSGSYDKTIRLWETEGNLIGSPFKGHDRNVDSVAFSPDGKYIVSGSGDKTIRLWDTKGNSIVSPFKGHKSAVSSVAFSPDGKYIVSGSDDKTIRLWSREGNPIGSPFKGHDSDVWSVAFSPDGKYIVSGSHDATIGLWDTEGNPIWSPFKGHESAVFSVAFSPDGKYIVSGRFNKTIRLWDTKGNSIGSPFKGHESKVESVAFSPDGKYIVSGSFDKTIRLWDTEGNPIGSPFKGHESAVYSVAFSPDGKYIVSGSSDKTIRLWDTEGNPIGSPFKGHESAVYSVAFSPDGKYIVSGSTDKTIRLWHGGNWEYWLAVACDKLQLHPVLAGPEPDENAKMALKTCQKHVWHLWDDIEKAKFSIRQGWLLVLQKQDVSGALAKFDEAHKLDGTVDLEANKKFAHEVAAHGVIFRGEKLAYDGEVKAALAAFAQARQLHPQLQISADSWNTLCWNGSLYEDAASVMHACKQGVALEPENGDYRRSRGLARALTGDTAGAIEDFQAFVKWSESREDGDEERTLVQGWIDDIRAGEDPFTEEVLKELRW